MSMPAMPCEVVTFCEMNIRDQHIYTWSALALCVSIPHARPNLYITACSRAVKEGFREVGVCFWGRLCSPTGPFRTSPARAASLLSGGQAETASPSTAPI